MQRHLDAGHKTLPLVIPVLFYTGKRSPYPIRPTGCRNFDDPALAEKTDTGDFPLVDVTVIPDEEIMGHRSMAALDPAAETYSPARPGGADGQTVRHFCWPAICLRHR